MIYSVVEDDGGKPANINVPIAFDLQAARRKNFGGVAKGQPFHFVQSSAGCSPWIELTLHNDDHLIVLEGASWIDVFVNDQGWCIAQIVYDNKAETRTMSFLWNPRDTDIDSEGRVEIRTNTQTVFQTPTRKLQRTHFLARFGTNALGTVVFPTKSISMSIAKQVTMLVPSSR